MIYETNMNKPSPQLFAWIHKPQSWILVGRRVFVVKVIDYLKNDHFLHFSTYKEAVCWCKMEEPEKSDIEEPYYQPKLF